jgi:catalase-peroxidase
LGTVSSQVPFAPGRTDATQAMTDAHSFAVLEPKTDGFRNFYLGSLPNSTAQLLVQRSELVSEQV